MEELIEKLKCTIVIEAQKKIVYNDEFIKIKEDTPNAKLKSITINKFNSQDITFAFSLDLPEFNTVNKISYINKKNINKGCDGIIFLLRNNNLFILLCELKSDKPHKRDFENQLKSSEAFVYYLLKIISIFDDIQIPEKQVIFKRLLFDTRINKNTTHMKNQKYSIYRIGCDEGDKNTFPIKKLLDIS